MNYLEIAEEIKAVMHDQKQLREYCKENKISMYWFTDNEVIKGGVYVTLDREDFGGMFSVSYEQTTYLQFWKGL